MKIKAEEVAGISLVGGIGVKNSSEYRRKVIKNEKGTKVRFGPIERARPKQGRNAPCPCGSGKKSKACCHE